VGPLQTRKRNCAIYRVKVRVLDEGPQIEVVCYRGQCDDMEEQRKNSQKIDSGLHDGENV